MKPEAPLLQIMGPTASGKTALSLALAEHVPIEIISVDSAQVYRGLDIGTAKPNAQERAVVPHHLIDIREVDDPYSAAQFKADAEATMQAIRARNRIPVLVGGTMLYFRALAGQLAPLPDADPAIRQRLVDEAEVQGWPHLHRRLARVDPLAAERIHPNDPQRIQRALEVWEISGEALSILQARGQTSPSVVQPGIRIALMPEQRGWLHARIEKRFDQMLAAGFLDEVRRLINERELSRDLPALRSVGYRQALEFLDAGYPGDAEAFRARAIAATRQMAKRQLTWLRGTDGLQKIACDRMDRRSVAATLAARLS